MSPPQIQPARSYAQSSFDSFSHHYIKCSSVSTPRVFRLKIACIDRPSEKHPQERERDELLQKIDKKPNEGGARALFTILLSIGISIFDTENLLAYRAVSKSLLWL